MLRENFAKGLQILNNYTHHLQWKTNGKYTYTSDVWNEDLSPEDMDELAKLGFCRVDDVVGFEDTNRFNHYFDKWWRGIVGGLDLSVFPADALTALKGLAYRAMMSGTVTCFADSAFGKSAVEASEGVHPGF